MTEDQQWPKSVKHFLIFTRLVEEQWRGCLLWLGPLGWSSCHNSNSHKCKKGRGGSHRKLIREHLHKFTWQQKLDYSVTAANMCSLAELRVKQESRASVSEPVELNHKRAGRKFPCNTELQVKIRHLHLFQSHFLFLKVKHIPSGLFLSQVSMMTEIPSAEGYYVLIGGQYLQF